MSETIDRFRLDVGSDAIRQWCVDHGLDPNAIAARDVFIDDDGVMHLFQYDLPRRVENGEVVGHPITVRPKYPIPTRGR